MSTRNYGLPWSPPRTVLYLIDELCGLDGGAEGALLRMTRTLDPRRYSCVVATFKHDRERSVAEQFPCPVHVLPLRRTYDLNGMRTAVRLSRLIRSLRPDVVHTFFETSDLWGGPVARLSGCARVVSSRRDMGFLRRPMHKVAYRLLRGMFAQVQTVSDQVREVAIREDRLPPSRVVTVHNGVDLDAIRLAPPDARPWAGWETPPSHVIATVGYIRAVKGTDVFVRAAEIVCRRFPRALFLVIGDVGDPGYHRELCSFVRERGLEQNVRFAGRLANVPGVLKNVDVFCLLSRSEGFSNALLEAMACGVPGIATRVGGNPEAITDGLNGYLVHPGDAEQAAARILDLLEDPASAERMGRVARRTVESRFTIQVMVERLMALYDGLILR
jgi:glycosyltransferase involved in cell wall biosynthesis